MRFSLRVLVLGLMLIAVAIGLWTQRGRWIVSSLIEKKDKNSWHALLRLNNLDPNINGLGGKPMGVWKASESSNATTWVLTKQGSLTVVGWNGTILDLGGIQCNGKPDSLWTGTTPDGTRGLVLASTRSSEENYLMFVVLNKRPTVRLLVALENDAINTSVTLVNGWPTVKLSTENDTLTEMFAFPGNNMLNENGQTPQPRPWKVVRSQ